MLQPSSTPDGGGATRVTRRTLAILVLTFIALGAVISVTYLVDFGRNNGGALPAGCAKPAGGFLIVASKTGYNDSVSHGAPANPWPVITVHQGQKVTIVVCNIDVQAHGFQVSHYFDNSIETVAPGQVITIPISADQTGTFVIYCDILCSIHTFMQSGMLTVTK
jgi:FtsP/CotA-like multicopper oxidase with cupredoxin domain